MSHIALSNGSVVIKGGSVGTGCGCCDGICVAVTGSGFVLPTVYAIQSAEGDGVEVYSSGSLNNTAYIPIAASELVGVLGKVVPGTQLSEIRTAGRVVTGGSFHRQAFSYAGGISAAGGYFRALLEFRYDTNEGAESGALVILIISIPGVPISITYTKVVTLETLPDIASDTITFVPGEAVATAGITPGTVTVSRVVAPQGVEPRASQFLAAGEAHLTVAARGLQSSITYTRSSSLPDPFYPPAIGFPNYYDLPAGSFSAFTYLGAYGRTWLLVVEPSCSLSGKLEIGIWGSVGLPGTPESGNDNDWQVIPFDSYLGNLYPAPPYSHHDDFVGAVFGGVQFPSFPIQLYDGPSHYYISSSVVRSGLPRVTISIDGVS